MCPSSNQYRRAPSCAQDSHMIKPHMLTNSSVSIKLSGKKARQQKLVVVWGRVSGRKKSQNFSQSVSFKPVHLRKGMCCFSQPSLLRFLHFPLTTYIPSAVTVWLSLPLYYFRTFRHLVAGILQIRRWIRGLLPGKPTTTATVRKIMEAQPAPNFSVGGCPPCTERRSATP